MNRYSTYRWIIFRTSHSLFPRFYRAHPLILENVTVRHSFHPEWISQGIPTVWDGISPTNDTPVTRSEFTLWDLLTIHRSPSIGHWGIDTFIMRILGHNWRVSRIRITSTKYSSRSPMRWQIAGRTGITLQIIYQDEYTEYYGELKVSIKMRQNEKPMLQYDNQKWIDVLARL
jgi:hypothetical protein